MILTHNENVVFWYVEILAKDPVILYFPTLKLPMAGEGGR